MKDRVKILYWDRTGYALWYKRLEKSSFPWPHKGEQIVSLTPQMLGWLLDGIDIFKIRPHNSVKLEQSW